MGESLSLDLRERVLAFIEEGHSCHEAARRFRISAASAVRIRQRYRQLGSVAPAKRGRPAGSGRLERFGDFLRARIERSPDMTMPELSEALWQAHGMRAAPAELSRFVRHRLGFTYKKIPGRNGAAARAGARRAPRVAAPADAEDAH
jgi:transposase